MAGRRAQRVGLGDPASQVGGIVLDPKECHESLLELQNLEEQLQDLQDHLQGLQQDNSY